MTNKQTILIRLGGFLLFSFGLSWIPFFLFYDAENASLVNLLQFFIMFTPAAGAVLARLLTKEGLRKSYLHLHAKGNLKYYLLSATVPVLSSLAGGILLGIYFAKDLTDPAIFAVLTPVSYISTIFSAIASAAAISFIALGEELGWRGYLIPKLELLVGTPAALLIGGIIWGLWHAPIVAEGLNFGTAYDSHPYGGIAAMCLFCLADGCFLTWLVKRTGSVLPAAIAHSVNNNVGGLLTSMYLADVDTQAKQFEIACIASIPVIAAGIFFFSLLLLEQRKKRVPQRLGH